jgi:trimethylamine---corrinoid protein Co-methyltransferase
MRVLSEIGIEFLNDEALGHLAGAGCTVSRAQTVRWTRDFVMEMVAKRAAEFTITPRNPDRAMTHRRAHMAFVNVSSPPNVGPRPRQAAGRPRELPRPHQAHAVLQLHPLRRRLPGGAGRHPPLGPPSRLPLRQAVLTDKVVHAYSLGPERVEDVMEMVRIAGA